MTRPDRDLEDALPLSEPVYQILLSIKNDPRHGYAIIQDVSDRTAGAVELTASTLYAALRRLLDDRWIEEMPEPDPQDARRRNYRISADGLTVLRLEAERLDRAAAMARAMGLLSATSGSDGDS